MSNMSYCRFQNTNQDLQDCMEHLINFGLTGKDEHDENLSRNEFEAACELIEKCREVAEQFEHTDLYEVSKDVEFNNTIK